MNDSFYQRLARLRIEHGLSQEQLSAELGVSRQAISKWERGESTPDTNNLIALAEVYGMTLDELVYGASEVQEAAEAEVEPEAAPEAEPEPEAAPEEAPATEPEPEPEPIPQVEGDGAWGPDTATADASSYSYDYVSFDDAAYDDAPDYAEEPHSNRVSQGALYAAACVFAYMVLGVCFGMWHPGWLVFLVLPFYYVVVRPVEQGRPLSIAAYPMLIVFLYLVLGAFFGLWHPGWILFLTIPFYVWWHAHGAVPRSPEGLAVLVAFLFALVVIMALVSRTVEATKRVTGLFGCGRQPEVAATSTGENATTQYVDAASVQGLAIDWDAGAAIVRVADDKQLEGQVEIAEASQSGWRSTPHMSVENRGGVLTIRYSDRRSGMVSCSSSMGKTLTVTLPKSCAERLGVVSIDGSSGSYELADLVCQRMEVDLGSGTFAAKGVQTQELNLDLSSGSVDFDGQVSKAIGMDVSSGKANIRTSVAPATCAFDVSSGLVTLLVPKDTGFTARTDVGSGSFSSDFETTKRGDTFVAGDGAMTLDVDVSSGEVHVGTL